MRQVITIGPDGSMSGLQHKRGRGLDLRQFGHAEIVRASEIVWSETRQKWRVQMLTGPLVDKSLTPDCWDEATGLPLPAQAYVSEGGTLFFDEYEDAVEAEIAVLDGLRLKGLLT